MLEAGMEHGRAVTEIPFDDRDESYSLGHGEVVGNRA
jgi:hypothetical protein